MDQKVSGLPQATSVMAADNLILNQNGVTKRIAITDFFGSGLPVPVKLAGPLMLGSTPEQVQSGPVSLSILVSQVILNGSSAISIPNGTESQIKVLVAGSGNGGVTVLTGNLYATAIQFSQLGDSALLMFTAGKWAFLGGTASLLGAGSAGQSSVDLSTVYATSLS
jgi:hypothetical protein